MSNAELQIIRNALVLFRASAKTDYNRILENYGADNLLTKAARRYYKSSLEALSIAEKELDGKVWDTIKEELEEVNK